MSKKLTMLSGLPASGKSTLAREMMENDRNLGRVNRDELRKMIFNGRWSNYNEKIVIQVEEAISNILLECNRDVVVDDTNLSPRHENMWKSFCEGYNTGHEDSRPVEFSKKRIETDYFTCAARDELRGEGKVGTNVITKMALRNKLINFPDREIVLVDIDGTLADGSKRQHHLRGEKKDWDKYYSLLSTDTPITHVFKWVRELSKEYTIVIVSGRGAENEEATKAWFEHQWFIQDEEDVPFFSPFLWIFRDKNDRRPDDIVKKEFLDLLPRRPVLILDDRPQVVRMWRSLGLKVIPVAGECEEF